VTVVHYQAAAETDLVEIWLQIAGDGDYKHADEYILRLQEIYVLVAGQPGMGVDRQDIAIGVRSFPVDRYVAYYEQHGPVLSVLRVWHTVRVPETLSIAE
jgi:toxin ParE1/3/4